MSKYFENPRPNFSCLGPVIFYKKNQEYNSVYIFCICLCRSILKDQEVGHTRETLLLTIFF
jgi:hypothetical protein